MRSAGPEISISAHSGGTIDFTGATLDLGRGLTLLFDDADGTYAFGSFATAGGAGIAIVNGSAGAFTFGDIDIADLGAGQTAVDLTGATGNVTFQTLDIAGSDGTGIDLTGSTTAANIIINESSSITGVNVGVDLTNAAITGTFRYGDGLKRRRRRRGFVDQRGHPDRDRRAQSGRTPPMTSPMSVLTGDTSGLQTNKTVYWVQLGAVGAGTRADPGSLAGAAASGADVIVLLETQVGAGQEFSTPPRRVVALDRFRTRAC